LTRSRRKPGSRLDRHERLDADAENDATVFGRARVALDHGALQFDRTAHGFDRAAELRDEAIPCALTTRP
jgi:hypothetical protein